MYRNKSRTFFYYKKISNIYLMAERLGFEPRKELPLCRFSRPVLSTAQPSLLSDFFITIIGVFKNKIDIFHLILI